MSLLNGLTDSDENFELKNQIEDLKGQLNVCNLKLKDREFTLNKQQEDYEFQLSKSKEDLTNLKDKYEKVCDGQGKLEKQNSDLEDRLLKIVQKYEDEQKTLLEELTIAHSQLVEAKLTITNLEKEKESFRKDCNLAVSLLQCKPGDFVKHSYNALPVNLKDRLRTLLTDEEALKLEEDGQREDLEYQKQKSNSLFKIPIFQPSAAAAMMYNMQNVSIQQRNLKQIDSEQEDSSKSYFNPLNYVPSFFETKNETKSDEASNENGKISSKLIAQILKKEPDAPSKKSFKLFPYVCLRCKKETVICSSSAQYDINDLSVETLAVKFATKQTLENENDLMSNKIGSNNVENIYEDKQKNSGDLTNTSIFNRADTVII